MNTTWKNFLVAAAMAAGLWTTSANSAGPDPQALLKDAERLWKSGDTLTARTNWQAVIRHPQSPDWMIIEALKQVSNYVRASSDSDLVKSLFSRALASPAGRTSGSTVLSLLMGHPALSGEDKLGLLAGVQAEGTLQEELLEDRIRLLRNLGRLEPALEFAARLAQLTSRMDHRLLMVDLLLDLSRPAEAASVATEILRDFTGDPGAYAELAERFYRHGDYQRALDIHRRARRAFSNPGLFFDQSLSICQGLQLGKEGIELYLPQLSSGPIPAPEYFRDFLAMVSDTVFLTQTYPAWIAAGTNPNLYFAAHFRFADIAPDTDCLDFARMYVQAFNEHSAHLDMAEHLLRKNRMQAFQIILADVPDSPALTAESKRILLFRHALQTSGPAAALGRFPPESFQHPPIRAMVYRLSSDAYYRAGDISRAISDLLEAHKINVAPADFLNLSRLHFLADRNAEALKYAHRAHSSNPGDESLYWLGLLSYLESDTKTAATALRDAVLQSESFLADEALAWLIALGSREGASPKDIGTGLRNALLGKTFPVGEADFPVAVRLALWNQAIRSGLAESELPHEKSPFLQAIRWEATPKSARTDAQYQKILMNSPEYLQPLIRTEEPAK